MCTPNQRTIPLSASLTVALSLLFAVACASSPQTRSDQRNLEMGADSTLRAMIERDPSLQPILDQAVGYVVFPTVAEGAALVGVTQGVGVVFVDDRPIGYAELREGSVGAQLGAQSYSQLVVFSTRAAWDRFLGGQFDFNANASATALTAGAAASEAFADGVAVFIQQEAGMMAEASIGGQTLSYIPICLPAGEQRAELRTAR